MENKKVTILVSFFEDNLILSSRNVRNVFIEDVKNIIEIAIQQSSWSGPYNICSPKSVTNKEMTALINQKYKKFLTENS